MLTERKRQACQGQNSKRLKDVEDDTFVLPEDTKSGHCSHGGKEREATGRSNRGEDRPN